MTVCNTTPIDTPETAALKRQFNDLASAIEASVLPGRRKSLALTNLEQAAMWAVKALTQGDE